VVAKLRSSGDTNRCVTPADKLRGALGRGAAVLALEADGKLTFLAAVTGRPGCGEEVARGRARENVAKVTGGSGGGKPHLALAGRPRAGQARGRARRGKRILSEALA
jgi:alanyl-tRNA synthetase